MSFVESIRLNFRNKIYIPLTCKRRGKKLKNKNFTIISNNCWGGTVYEAYNLPKGSPTVGLFFMAKDYIEFLSDLKGYLEGSLTFIKPEESRWKDYVEVGGDERFGTYPIGLLSNGKKNVEVFFLHYHDEKEAYDKWTRRIGRINWERLLVKFNDQNGCTETEVEKFMSLPFKNKLFFTCKHWPDKAKEQIVIKQFPKHNFILASYEPFGKSKYIDITEVLNSL
ncbi:DUF1919 domain-containing protein [Streptococcus sp. KCJ4932]|uniref:DUF1919 domain-containing protein n=1 Tax=Streptococcus sp. KCJ4932 TaxID=2545465 RepID=UPI00105581C1|nr:DUF1919 domain-containing protein [Streptococcus sp. KCJ4932]TDE68820.1 DUF1919 domain-containing protein [Streptococcus sp. KCJ4932]